MDVWKIILIAAAVGVAFGIIGFILGGLHRKRVAEAAIGSATKEANRIVSEAMTQAEAKKKEAILEAKDEIHKQRSENEKELRERRNEVQRQERRVIQKEESLDKKIENLEKKDETLNRKIKDADDRLAEAESLKRSQLDMLEKISGYSKEQAKEYLLKNLEDDLVHEKAVKVLEYQQRTKDEADTIAREIIGTAIQRCAADHTAETTVSVVALPNDEMKGRIIGREGRNVRTLETITGVDLIIDDTPEAITVSSFDPVRREVARIAAEGFDAGSFERAKRASLGARLRGLEDFDNVCVSMAMGLFDGYCALDAFRLLESVTAEECRRFAAENLCRERLAMSVIEPKSNPIETE